VCVTAEKELEDTKKWKCQKKGQEEGEEKKERGHNYSPKCQTHFLI
jgi:hypothetical protein